MIQKKLQELCKRLKDNDPSLRELNLSYANIGIDGARALRDALKHNKYVNFIRLHHSNLGFKGTKLLFEGLKGRGVKTSVSIIDDYNDAEFDELLMMTKQPPKEKRGAFGNKKGIDDKIFANLENNGRGHVAVDQDKSKEKAKDGNDKMAESKEQAAVAATNASSSRENS